MLRTISRHAIHSHFDSFTLSFHFHRPALVGRPGSNFDFAALYFHVPTDVLAASRVEVVANAASARITRDLLITFSPYWVEVFVERNCSNNYMFIRASRSSISQSTHCLSYASTSEVGSPLAFLPFTVTVIDLPSLATTIFTLPTTLPAFLLVPSNVLSSIFL